MKYIKAYSQINEQKKKYSVVSEYFEMFGSYRVDMRVSDSTGTILFSSGGEGTSKEEAYKKAKTKFEPQAKKIGIAVPTIDELKKTE